MPKYEAYIPILRKFYRADCRKFNFYARRNLNIFFAILAKYVEFGAHEVEISEKSTQ